MDNQGNFKEQSMTNMQKAVYAGEMTVADYYEKQCELKAAEQNGVDDGSSCTKGMKTMPFFPLANIEGAHFRTQ
jgi:zinc finger-containing ubiquitin peptidase 1